MVGESYNRAYSVMVNIQLLSEMEEICLCLASPERKPQLRKIWWDRLLVSDDMCSISDSISNKCSVL